MGLFLFWLEGSTLFWSKGSNSFGLRGQSELDFPVLNENKQLFASQYMDYLPTEKELEEEIERQKAILKLSVTKGENNE